MLYYCRLREVYLTPENCKGCPYRNMIGCMNKITIFKRNSKNVTCKLREDVHEKDLDLRR